jgi:neutral ceramidase
VIAMKSVSTIFFQEAFLKLIPTSMKTFINKFWVSIFLILVASSLQGQSYLVGTGQESFTRLLNGSLPHNVATFGYGDYSNPIDTTITNENDGVVNGVHSDLKSRVISIIHPVSRKRLTYVLLDLAFASENIRRKLVEKLRLVDPDFDSASLVLTATHTHSAPGGHSCYLGYEVPTPGHRPDVLESVVENTYKAIISSWEYAVTMEAVYAESTVPDDMPIAFNRNGLPAYNNNPEMRGKPEVTFDNNYEATDRLWQMIAFEKDGQLHSMLNLFGVHPNRIVNAKLISSDTRGAASGQMESALPEGGIALFAQNAPGDIDAEWFYSGRVDKSNELIYHPAYYDRDANGNPVGISSKLRIEREGELLKTQALNTYSSPEEEFMVQGDIDYELIYIDMGNQVLPRGNYAKTLKPNDYYVNDFFLFPGAGPVLQFFNPKYRNVRTSPPAFGLGALLSAFTGPEAETFRNLERIIRYTRLAAAPFQGKYGQYVFDMYRAQANKHVALEGGEYKRAFGLTLDGPLYGLVEGLGLDARLTEFRSQSSAGLFDEHTILPQMVPLQIVIIGNVALVNVPGEPGNMAGQRIERLVFEHLKQRNIKRVIVNGYCNENTGYIFTPEEYLFQETPGVCGFVLFGKWTEPAFRFNFGKLAKAMLLDPEDRDAVLDRTLGPPEFSSEWYQKASFLVPAAR